MFLLDFDIIKCLWDGLRLLSDYHNIHHPQRQPNLSLQRVCWGVILWQRGTTNVLCLLQMHYFVQPVPLKHPHHSSSLEGCDGSMFPSWVLLRTNTKGSEGKLEPICEDWSLGQTDRAQLQLSIVAPTDISCPCISKGSGTVNWSSEVQLACMSGV